MYKNILILFLMTLNLNGSIVEPNLDNEHDPKKLTAEATHEQKNKKPLTFVQKINRVGGAMGLISAAYTFATVPSKQITTTRPTSYGLYKSTSFVKNVDSGSASTASPAIWIEKDEENANRRMYVMAKSENANLENLTRETQFLLSRIIGLQKNSPENMHQAIDQWQKSVENKDKRLSAIAISIDNTDINVASTGPTPAATLIADVPAYFYNRGDTHLRDASLKPVLHNQLAGDRKYGEQNRRPREKNHGCLIVHSSDLASTTWRWLSTGSRDLADRIVMNVIDKKAIDYENAVPVEKHVENFVTNMMRNSKTATGALIVIPLTDPKQRDELFPKEKPVPKTISIAPTIQERATAAKRIALNMAALISVPLILVNVLAATPGMLAQRGNALR